MDQALEMELKKLDLPSAIKVPQQRIDHRGGQRGE